MGPIRAIDKNNRWRKLGIEVTSLQRAHRIGVYREQKKRPIIANFASYKERQEILSNAKKLKGSELSIDQDFAPATREVRKRLWEYGKAHKSESTKVRLNFDRLSLDEKTYVWDDEKNEVVPLRKK